MARSQTCVTWNCFLKKPQAREQIADRLNVHPDDLIPVKSGRVAPYVEAYNYKSLGENVD